ncbi:MAG: phosphoribosylanthranilate isomerase [Chitinophagia bacterium]|jgi:phosphoribosylanthranilate isomerase|nr:phosphoribosylanthranilate isomerase [Chitinophagia bacterium]
MQIKVCGMTQMEQVKQLDEMGVAYIGFIFYPASKRFVLTKNTLQDIADLQLTQAKKVGVFVNEPLTSILDIIKTAQLDMVQLHGDETVAYCKRVQEEVSTIKVFRVGDSFPNFEEYVLAVDYFLFDTDSQWYGGTGQHFNWEIIKSASIPTPFFLSGGIGINDVQGIQVMAGTKAGKTMLAVDLNSQFEEKPGVKQIEKIKKFIQDVNH